MLKSKLTVASLLVAAAAIPAAGFAVAADPVDPNADAHAQAQAEQEEQLAYLGVASEPLDFDSADLLMLDHGTGLNVTAVAPDSPAQAAGIEPGDVLLKFNDQLLINPEQLAVLIRTQQPGEAVSVELLRAGETLTLDVELGGVADLPAIGPGGRAVNDQAERAEQLPQRPARRELPQEIELERLDPADIEQHMLDIERRIRAQQEMMLRFIEEIEGGRPADMDRQIQELLEQAERQMQQQRPGPAPHIGVRAQMHIASNDGEHRIQIAGNPNHGQGTLNITDRQGNVLFDGELPQTDEQWEQVPEPARTKARRLLDMHNIRIELEPAEPQVERELPQA